MSDMMVSTWSNHHIVFFFVVLLLYSDQHWHELQQWNLKEILSLHTAYVQIDKQQPCVQQKLYSLARCCWLSMPPHGILHCHDHIANDWWWLESEKHSLLLVQVIRLYCIQHNGCHWCSINITHEVAFKTFTTTVGCVSNHCKLLT